MDVALDEVVYADHAPWIQYEWIEANLRDDLNDLMKLYCYK